MNDFFMGFYLKILDLRKMFEMIASIERHTCLDPDVSRRRTKQPGSGASTPKKAPISGWSPLIYTCYLCDLVRPL